MSKARDLATLLNSSGQITSAKIGDGEVTATDLASTLNLTGKSVTLPAGVGGKLLSAGVQPFNVNYSTTSSSWNDTGYSISITPVSASSLIVIEFSGVAFLARGWAAVNVRLFDNTAGSMLGSERQVFRYDFQNDRYQYVYSRVWGSQMWSTNSWGTTSRNFKIQMYADNGQESGFNNASSNTVFMRYWEIAQ